jgi:LPXTG-motif cell wall-anchored protein
MTPPRTRTPGRWTARAATGALLAALGLAAASATAPAVAGPPAPGLPVTPSAEGTPVGAPGEVVVWGRSDDGQTAVPDAATDGVVAVSAGFFGTIALRTDGTVVGWGDGVTPPAAADDAVAISAGAYHYLALQDDGSIVSWGDPSGSAATAPAGATPAVAIAAGGAFSLTVNEDGAVSGWGLNHRGQTTVPAGASSDVVSIAAGQEHSMALKGDGTVLAWGSNSANQSTAPASVTAPGSDVVAIAAGSYHSLALKTDGSVVAWGQAAYGQSLVPAGATSHVVAIAAGGTNSMALKDDGSLVIWGGNSWSESTPPADVAGSHAIQAIAAGFGHSIALVASAPAITSGAPAATATVGTAYSHTFTATGATGWSLASGALPAGLTLSAGGVLSGTPTTAQTATFTVEATGVGGTTESPVHTVTVSAASSPTPSGPGTPDVSTTAPKPGAPVGVTASADAARVAVSWRAPASGAAVDRYRVTLAPGGQVHEVRGTSTLFGVEAGKAYTATVVALTAGGTEGPGTSASTGMVAGPVVPATVPATPLTLTTDRGPITKATAGQEITVIGTGFLPFSTATVVIYSTPQVLGSVVTDAAGAFRTTVTVPSTLEAGQHSLVASGIAPDGSERLMRLDVTVTAAGAQLASTGASPLVPALAGAAALLAGTAMLVVSRRRRA